MKYVQFIEDDNNRNKLWLVIDNVNAPTEELVAALNLKEEQGGAKGNWFAEWTMLSRCGARLVSVSPYLIVDNSMKSQLITNVAYFFLFVIQ